MRQDLNASFRHLTGLDARHCEFGDVRPRLGLDRPLELRERADAKTRRREPAMRGDGIRDRECREMNPGIPRHRAVKLAAERRVRRLVENLDIAAIKHARHIAGPGQNHAAFAVLGLTCTERGVAKKPALVSAALAASGSAAKWPTWSRKISSPSGS